jgi:hypothetical protein
VLRRGWGEAMTAVGLECDGHLRPFSTDEPVKDPAVVNVARQCCTARAVSDSKYLTGSTELLRASAPSMDHW